MNKYTATLTVLVFGAIYVVKTWTRRSRLPPGPRGWPLIGNLLDMPSTDEWRTYAQWVKEFNSDILHLDICGTHIVILNSLEACVELLERRSSIYSTRHRSVSDLMGYSWNLACLAYNDNCRAQRRYFHHEFEGRAIQAHYPSITNASHDLLQRFLDAPEKWQSHVRHAVGATIMDVAYGIEVQPVNDPYVATAEAAFASVTIATLPGAFMVDMMPILKHVPAWMPGAGFQRKAQAWHKLSDAVLEVPFATMKKAMAAGTARPSFCSRSIQEIDPKGDVKSEEFCIQAAAGTMYNAGSDTTVSLLESFILAMVLHPEVQAKAQAEMDLVLGPGHLPTFGDQELLPYFSAIMSECFRWEVVAPSGLPHMLTADDEYKGYVIPKGTIIIANAHQILHDESVYPDPYTFKPERFLKDGKIDQSVMNPTIAAFGFGRRVCPGRGLAEKSAWLTCGSILAAFHLSKATDAKGATIEPSARYLS
ncbi:cytochrome P450, partial [Athelia psychrophila]